MDGRGRVTFSGFSFRSAASSSLRKEYPDDSRNMLIHRFHDRTSLGKNGKTATYARKNRNEVPYRDLLVPEINLTIRTGDTISIHGLLFDDLTVGEMKRDGFCGPVYLKDSDDVIHECELTASNPEYADGSPLNGLVFTVDCPRESGLKAEVVKWSFRKAIPRRAGKTA